MDHLISQNYKNKYSLRRVILNEKDLYKNNIYISMLAAFIFIILKKEGLDNPARTQNNNSRRDLNPRPPDPESCALSSELHG